MRTVSAFVLALLLAVATGAAAETAPTAPPPSAHALTAQDLEAWLDGFVPFALKDGDIAGMVVAVVKDGNVLLKKGYGYADVKAKKPMDPDRTLVRPGSTSKLFTWTAVMQLVEQGKLALDRDINEYLDFRIESPFGKPITMLDLMNHRGGFEEGLKSILATDPATFESTEQYLKAHQRPILFPAGEVPAYSNYGTALAGYIVQRISGESYESYVQQHIFDPLGMTHSTFVQPLPEAMQADMANGYMTASGPAQKFELIATAPAGSLSTTADDMTKFMLAHLQRGRVGDAQILKAETADQMHQPSAPRAAVNFATMAHGFFDAVYNGHRIIGHGGDSVVFHTDMNLLLDDGVGIFFNVNSRGAQSSNYAARAALFKGFVDRYFPAAEKPKPATESNSPEHARMIAGRYQTSRRVEHGFISVFYLLQQASITANDDGSISVPDPLTGEPKKLHETEPFVWRDDERETALALKDGTVWSQDDPTSVLQPAPAWKSSALNLTIMSAATAILLMAAILWPVGAIQRRQRGERLADDPRVRRAHWLLRIGAVFDVAYLAAWMMVLQPVLSSRLDVYGAGLDPVIRALQFAGLVVIVFGVAGLPVWLQARGAGISRGASFWNFLIASALIGVVWIGLVGKLIGFGVNY